MINRFKVVFVLGGPGSGKGTQSSLIQKKFRFKHLSAGELLREEKKRPSSEYGSTIEKIILEGKIVPSFITTSLLKAAIKESQKEYQYFLIDGFPRNKENLLKWKQETSSMSQCPFVIHFKCSEKEMIKRLLKRAQQSHRSDDNLKVIRKRLNTYYSETKQVLEDFNKMTKVYDIDSDISKNEIFSQVSPIFEEFLSKQRSI